MEAYRMAKKKRNPANAAAIAHIFENYEIKSVLDIQEALKDMFGGAMEQMLAGELDASWVMTVTRTLRKQPTAEMEPVPRQFSANFEKSTSIFPASARLTLSHNLPRSIRRMFCRLKTACWRCMRRGNPKGISLPPFRIFTVSISAPKLFLKSPNGLSRWFRSLETGR